MIDKLKARLENRLNLPVECWKQDKHLDCPHDLIFARIDKFQLFVDHYPIKAGEWVKFEDFVVRRTVR